MKKIPWLDKPCRSCGSMNRGPGGKCRECARASEERKRRNADIAARSVYVGPCKKCGSLDRMKNGKCSECNKSVCRAAYANNKEKYLAANKEWAKRNPEKIKEHRKMSIEKNPTGQAAASKRWRENNKDKFLAARKRWREENKELLRIFCINRRRRIESAGKLSKNVAKIKFALQQGKCPCCTESIKNRYHIDHIIPIFLGGSNTDDNVQLLCPQCNLKKNAKHPVDYMQSLGYLI